MSTTNHDLLARAARALGELTEDLIFVGGCTTDLLITDPAAADVRVTHDVDVIAEITSDADYRKLRKRLRALGFGEDTSEGAPLCRWKHESEITLDVMPSDEKILGFSNPWYSDAIAWAVWHQLEPDLRIRVTTSPYFCATKITAFHGRGRGDYAASHDLEDFLAVVDGRATLAEEIAAAEARVKNYVASETAALLANGDFLDALPGSLLPDPASQARLPLLRRRLADIADL